jgi:hypothetical protein
MARCAATPAIKTSKIPRAVSLFLIAISHSRLAEGNAGRISADERPLNQSNNQTLTEIFHVPLLLERRIVARNFHYNIKNEGA